MITHPDGWLAKVVTNLCLNRLTAARATRERYVGPWLPEPVPTDALGPLETAEQRESVSLALLAMPPGNPTGTITFAEHLTERSGS